MGMNNWQLSPSIRIPHQLESCPAHHPAAGSVPSISWDGTNQGERCDGSVDTPMPGLCRATTSWEGARATPTAPLCVSQGSPSPEMLWKCEVTPAWLPSLTTQYLTPGSPGSQLSPHADFLPSCPLLLSARGEKGAACAGGWSSEAWRGPAGRGVAGRRAEPCCSSPLNAAFHSSIPGESNENN